MISGNTILAPVTTTDIRNLTGCPSNSVNYLITAAKTGGVNGRAFNTTLGGGSITQGYLIDGARPYWNIFSNESPGEWVNAALDGPLQFRLKRDASGRYKPDLGYFRGYEHNAISPENLSASIRVPIGASTSQQVVIRGRSGSYDWRKLNPGIPVAVKFVIFDEEGFQVGQSDPQELTAVNMTVSIAATVNIVSTSSTYSKTYTIREYIGRKMSTDFMSFGYIPVTGTMTVTVYTPIPEASFAIRMNNAPNTAWSITNFYKSNNVWMISAKFRRGSTTEKMRNLYKIEYTLVDENDNTGNTVTVTSFNNNDYPLTLSDYGADTGYNEVLFNVQYDRLIPTVAYPQVRIIIYYG